MRTSLPYIVICLALTGTSCNYVPCRLDRNGPTAIVGAFEEETALLNQQMSNRQEHSVEGISFFTGKLSSRQIVLAETGIGKVNAAMVTTLVIEKFEPDEVIFSGIAGALNPELSPGDIVIAEKIAQHDYGLVSDAGFETTATINPIDNLHNPLFFAADKRLLGVARTAGERVSLNQVETTEGLIQPKITTGVVVTGDCFVASNEFGRRLRESLGADAVEMEGAAVAQVCYQRKVPCIIIRSISDKADETAVADLERFQKMAARNSATLVAEMVQRLERSNSAISRASRAQERVHGD